MRRKYVKCEEESYKQCDIVRTTNDDEKTGKLVDVYDCSNKGWKNVPNDAFDIPDGTFIYLGGNPWRCNCDLVWFLNEIKNKNMKKKIANIDDMRCNEPSSYRGIIVTFLKETDICARDSSRLCGPKRVICPRHSKCEVRDTLWQCRCSEGYQLENNGHRCTKIQKPVGTKSGKRHEAIVIIAVGICGALLAIFIAVMSAIFFCRRGLFNRICFNIYDLIARSLKRLRDAIFAAFLAVIGKLRTKMSYRKYKRTITEDDESQSACSSFESDCDTWSEEEYYNTPHEENDVSQHIYENVE